MSLPKVLQEVSDAAGLSAALVLAREFGGIEIYVPKTLPERHRLAEALGLRAARALVGLYGGGHVLVPLGPWAGGTARHETIAKLLAEKKSAQKVARCAGCHIRTVRRHLSRLREQDPEQLDLLR